MSGVCPAVDCGGALAKTIRLRRTRRQFSFWVLDLLTPLVLAASLAALAFLLPGALAWARNSAPLASSLPATWETDRLAEVPPALRPWIGWVLRDEGDLRCPRVFDAEERRCAWPSRLSLEVNAHGGSFRQEWEIYEAIQVSLPGDGEHLPLEVRVDGKPGRVVRDEKLSTQVSLLAGHHVVTGVFRWTEAPSSLGVPDGTALLMLTVDGKAIPSPRRSEEGTVLLEGERDQPDEDDLKVAVQRKVVDDVPLALHTHMSLDVAGRSRDVVFAHPWPEGFTLSEVRAPIPVRVDAEGRLHMQVRAGHWDVVLTTRKNARTAGLTRPEAVPPWPAESEPWAFEARPALRTVEVSGSPALDPQQTLLPEDWRSFPAFAVRPGGQLVLQERQRGDSAPPPEKHGSCARPGWTLGEAASPFATR